MVRRLTLPVTLLAATLLLGACESSEERAEEHYQSGLALLEAGDPSRATLEMRNALQLDPAHAEARLVLARLLRERGNLPRAVGHYRDLVERYPETGAAHLALAEIALDLGDWDMAQTHGPQAEQHLGATPQVRAVQVNLAYRQALADQEREGQAAAVEEARSLLAADPALYNARRLVIDSLLRAEQWNEVLEVVDAGIAAEPDRFGLYQVRLGILEQLGRTDEVTAQLEDMVTRFPEETAIPDTLVRWYVQQEKLDRAEAFLRARAAETPEDLDRQTVLAQFIRQFKGHDAIVAELTRQIEAGGPHATVFRAMRANLMFENGERAEAIADLEATLAALPEEESHDETADGVRVDLARMKALTGDQAGATALVDAVLENDPSQTAALKLRGAWQIEADEVEAALVTLRAALRDSPRDPQIMTLMAAAHERAGEPELQREMLALAVENSRSAPPESLRYARILIADERYLPAEDILRDALRLHRGNVDLYTELGRVYVALADWSRVEQVIGTLDEVAEATGDERAVTARNALQAQALAGQQRDGELFGFLEELANSDAGLGADVAIIRAHVARGETAKARERLDQALAANPDNPTLKFLSAAVKASEGQYEEAGADLEALLAEDPQAEPVWIALYRLELVRGDQEAAKAVLGRALEALPDGTTLLFARATELEADGDIDGAIAIYETLYARNSNSEILANNLASLLSMYRDDPETLERAYRIGRRLQDSRVPAFRDTYGWIAARLGRFEEAEPHLAMAAEGYPQHPVVQFHHGVVLAGLGRDTEALEVFETVEELGTDALPEASRETLERELVRLRTDAAQAPDSRPDTTEGQ